MALVIALNKGRILKEVLPILEQCNVVLDEDPNNSRKLVFDSVDKFHKIVVVRGADVPAYVENGIADIGITGRIQFLNVIARLGFTNCWICRSEFAGFLLLVWLDKKNRKED